MKKFFTAIPAFLCLALGVSGQQLPLFHQYREYLGIINPGALTSDYLTYEYNQTAGISYRRQWVGIPNGISNQVARFEGFDTKNKLVYGGHFLRDQTGPSGYLGLYGRLGYTLAYDPKQAGLAFGLSLGVVQYAIDVQKINFTDQGDVMAQGSIQKIFPDVGLGIFGYTSVGSLEGDKIYGGISAPQTFGLDLTLRDDADNEFKVKRLQHFYANVGMLKYFNEDSFVEPSIWVKKVANTPLNIDFNVRFQLTQLLSLGGGYGTANNLHLETSLMLGDLLGLDNKLIRLGYGFDNYFSQIGGLFGPSHEINLVYAYSTLKARK